MPKSSKTSTPNDRPPIKKAMSKKPVAVAQLPLETQVQRALPVARHILVSGVADREDQNHDVPVREVLDRILTITANLTARVAVLQGLVPIAQTLVTRVEVLELEVMHLRRQPDEVPQMSVKPQRRSPSKRGAR